MNFQQLPTGEETGSPVENELRTPPAEQKEDKI